MTAGHFDAERKRELGLIHMAKKHLQLSQADYEHVLREVTGKTSSAELDAGGRDKLLRHFKAKGFKVLPKAGAKARDAGWGDPQRRKLRAMWYMLAEAGAVDQPTNGPACDQAIESWAKRQLNGTPFGPFDALRFASGEQMRKLIEEMKAWGKRVGAEII